MKLLRWLPTVLAAAVLASAPATGVQAAGPEKRDARTEERDKMFKEVGLSAEQKAKFEALQQARHQGLLTLREERERLMQDLRNLLDRGAAEAELTAKLEKIRTNWKALSEAMERHMEETQNLLTPVQRARFTLWMAEKREMPGGKRGGR